MIGLTFDIENLDISRFQYQGIENKNKGQKVKRNYWETKQEFVELIASQIKLSCFFQDV